MTRQSHVVVTREPEHGHVGARDGLVDADRLCERQPEHAETVGHADAEMNCERGDRAATAACHRDRGQVRHSDQHRWRRPYGQAGAAKLGIARALLEFNIELRAKLKELGFLTRDARAT